MFYCNLSVRAAVGRTFGQTDMMKLRDMFHDYAHVPMNL